MPNTYCVQCGAVNQIGIQNCIGCGAYLAAQPTYAASGDPGEWLPADSRDWEPLPDPQTAFKGIRSFSVGHVLGSTLRIYTKHLWLTTKIVFLVVTPFEIFKVMSLAHAPQDWQTISITWLLGIMCNVLIAPALVYALMKNLETGAVPGVNESFRWGLTKIGQLAVCAVISWVLQFVGYLLCIIPGIILSLTLAVVYPVAILEKESPVDVLWRSSELTRGHRWEILGVGIVLGLLVLAVIGPASLLLGNVNSVPLTVFASIVKDIAEQAFTVLSLVMYLTLIRTPTQGYTTLNLTN